MSTVLSHFKHDCWEVKRHITLIFDNLTYGAESSYIFSLYQNAQIMSYYVKMLKASNQNTLLVVLECLSNLLKYG